MLSNKFNFSLLSLVMIIVLIFCIKSPMPTDDLLRDVIIGNYDFDYNNLYIYAPLLTKYNQYIAFDKALYYLSNHIGKIWTIRVVQLSCIFLYIIPLILIFRKLLINRPDKHELITFCLSYTLIISIMSRLILGRPEVILASWVLFGITCSLYNNRLTKFLWMILGIILIPFYWLSILYTPAALVTFKKIKTKLLGMAILISLNIFIWQSISIGQWAGSFKLLHQSLANRLPDILVNENLPLCNSLLIPQVGLILVLLSYKIQLNLKKLCQKSNLRDIFKLCNFKKLFGSEVIWLSILCMWFCLSNMIRYLDVIMPILVTICIIQYKDIKYGFNSIFLRNFIFIIAIYLAILDQSLPNVYLPKFNLPENSRVLVSFDSANYSIPFYNKEKIFVAPSMEIGANERGIQELLLSIQKNRRLNCTLLKKYNFQFVVEKDLNTKPSCLELTDVDRSYRLWKVK